MMKVGDLLALALKDAGIVGTGQTASAEEEQDALLTLNQLLDTWRAESLMCYALKTVSVACTGANTYDIGPGADINTAWPERIEAAECQVGDIHYPLAILSQESFDQLRMTATSTVRYLYYDRAYPIGKIELTGPALTGATLNLSVWQSLPAFESLTDEVALPPGYGEALRYGLGEQLAALHGFGQHVQLLAGLALRAKKRLTQNNVRVLTLALPAFFNSPRFTGPNAFLEGR